MDIESGLIMPPKRRARFHKYRNGVMRRSGPKRKKNRKAKPAKLPKTKKIPHNVNLKVSEECYQSIRLVKRKSQWIEGLIMTELKRIYERNGRPWVEWPNESRLGEQNK